MDSRRDARYRYICLGLAICTAGAVLGSLHFYYGFNLSDEGFYWHGAELTYYGKTPVKDFFSYEPGRYYWTAAVFRLLGSHSNKAGRLASIAFGSVVYGVCTTYVANWYLNENSKPKRIFAACGLAAVASIWTFPYYRVYDNACACLTFTGCVAIQKQKRQNHKAAIAYLLGMTTFIGRNHGLYALIALISTFLLSSTIKKRDYRFKINVIKVPTACIAGIGIPFLIVEVFNKGFIRELIKSWEIVQKTGQTNRPMPLFWNIASINSGSSFNDIENAILSATLIIMIVGLGIAGFVIASGIRLTGRKSSILLISTVSSTLGYVHCTISRPDSVHVGTSMIPIILGVSLAGFQGVTPGRAGCILFTLYSTFRFALPTQMAYQCLKNSAICKKVGTGDEEYVWAHVDISDFTEKLVSIVDSKTFLALPSIAGLYSLMNRQSPGWGCTLFGLEIRLNKKFRLEN